MMETWEEFVTEHGDDIAPALNRLMNNPASQEDAELLALWISRAELERRRLRRKWWRRKT